MMLVGNTRAGSLGGTLVRRKRVIVMMGGFLAALSVGVPTSTSFTAGTLNLTETAIKDWKLRVASAVCQVGQPR